MPKSGELGVALEHLRDAFEKRDRWVLITNLDEGRKVLECVVAALRQTRPAGPQDCRAFWVQFDGDGFRESFCFLTVPRPWLSRKEFIDCIVKFARDSGLDEQLGGTEADEGKTPHPCPLLLGESFEGRSRLYGFACTVALGFTPVTPTWRELRD